MYPRRQLRPDELTNADTTVVKIRKTLGFESIDTALRRETRVPGDYSGFQIHDTMDDQMMPDLHTLQVEVEELTTKLDMTRVEVRNILNRMANASNRDDAPDCGCLMCLADRPVRLRLEELTALQEKQNAELKAKKDHLKEMTTLMVTDVANPEETRPSWRHDFSTFSRHVGPMGTSQVGYMTPDYAHSTPRPADGT